MSGAVSVHGCYTSHSNLEAMLWVDKHRPLSLEKMDYLKDQAAQLSRLASSGDLPHLLFYGPSGAGKKTRVMALLRAMFGAGVEKVNGFCVMSFSSLSPSHVTLLLALALRAFF